MQRPMVTAAVLLLLALYVAPSAGTPASANPGVLADASAPAPAAHALDGRPLYPATLADEAGRRLHADLTAAQAAFGYIAAEADSHRLK